MIITVNNKIELLGFPKNLNNFVMDELTSPNPVFTKTEQLGYSTFGVPEYLQNFEFKPSGKLIVPRGYRGRLLSILKEGNYPFKLDDLRKSFDYKGRLGLLDFNFRTYQKEYLQNFLSGQHDEGILVAAAGSGKTVMGLGIAGVLGQPFLWLTHTTSLFKQVIDRILSFNKHIKDTDIGRIYKGKWGIGDFITIGMVQTLIRNPDKLLSLHNKFGAVFLDEAHHAPARTFSEVISYLNPKFLYGLTATPNRSDGLQSLMYQNIGPVVMNIPTSVIVDAGGIILPTIIYKEVKTKTIDGNNVNAILQYLITHNRRNQMIVSDVLEDAMAGEVCIVLSTRKKHCEILYKLIKMSWDKTGIATGDYSEKDNDITTTKLVTGDITVVVTTPDLLGEGFDVDILSRGYIALPFRSETRIEQFLGRVQRAHPKKSNVYVTDYVDTSIGVLKDQFSSFKQDKESRLRMYNKLGLTVVPG